MNKFIINEKTLENILDVQIYIILAALDLRGKQLSMSPLFKDFDCNLDKFDEKEQVYVIQQLLNEYVDKDLVKFRQMYKFCWKLIRKLVESEPTYTNECNLEAFRKLKYKPRKKKKLLGEWKPVKPTISSEEEFSYYRQYHKIHTIQVARGLYNSGSLYSERLRKMFEAIKETDFYTVSCYLNKMSETKPATLNSMYEYCWKQVKNLTDDTKVYTKRVTNVLKKDYKLS